MDENDGQIYLPTMIILIAPHLDIIPFNEVLYAEQGLARSVGELEEGRLDEVELLGRSCLGVLFSKVLCIHLDQYVGEIDLYRLHVSLCHAVLGIGVVVPVMDQGGVEGF